jgi:hypothetical protein
MTRMKIHADAPGKWVRRYREEGEAGLA